MRMSTDSFLGNPPQEVENVVQIDIINGARCWNDIRRAPKN